jgi:hypothetical protein
MRRAEAAHGEHEKRLGAARRELVRLVCRVHGGGAGGDRVADLSDYDVVVVDGGAHATAVSVIDAAFNGFHYRSGERTGGKPGKAHSGHQRGPMGYRV